MPESSSAIYRAATLNKTLTEWEIGGNGEGIDVVRGLPLIYDVTYEFIQIAGLRDNCIWNGYRQSRCPVNVVRIIFVLRSSLTQLIFGRYIIHYDLPKSFEGAKMSA
jgi:hypothetical protein